MSLKFIPDNIPFMKYSNIALAGSGLLMLLTVVLLFTKGLQFGIDFTGGTLVQVKTAQEIPVSQVRSDLKEAGFAGLTIQEYGAPDEFLIRAPASEKTNNAYGEQIAAALGDGTQLRRVEFVGPQVGAELREKGLLGLLVALFAILVYISLRFEIRYGVGAIGALIHDIWLTVGFFSLISHQISLTVLAAMLTIIGYSLNDTIVVYDRVRENRRKFPKKPLEEVLDLSINEMLRRTFLTSLTTFVALVALYLFGGAVIQDFAIAMMFGVVVGTYSSIFIAAPKLQLMERWYQNRKD